MSVNATNVKKRFQCKFQDVTSPYREIIHRIMNKLRGQGSY